MLKGIEMYVNVTIDFINIILLLIASFTISTQETLCNLKFVSIK